MKAQRNRGNKNKPKNIYAYFQGTRALLKFIGSHSNVSTSGAEIHFFDRFYERGLDWYKDQMPFADPSTQLTIEKTPKYFINYSVPVRVHAMNPKTKIIIVLRDPVTRAVSEYTQAMQKLNKTDFWKYIKINHTNNFNRMAFDSKTENLRTTWSVIRNGIYYKHLQEWLKYFDLKQILFVNGEELIRDPYIELRKVENFLNLPNQIERKHFIYEPHKGFHCIVKPLKSGTVKCLSDQKGRKHPHIAKSTLQKLRTFYKPYNIALFKLIDEKPFWPV
jgi:hypothetical protein